MSTKLINAVWPLKLPPNEKFVLVVLADYVNKDDDNTCYPLIGSIGKRCGFSNRQISRIISSLIKKGYIRLKRRYKKSSYYQLLIGENDVYHDTGVMTPKADRTLILKPVVEEGCSPRKCGTWHMDCTAFRPPYWVSVSKGKRSWENSQENELF